MTLEGTRTWIIGVDRVAIVDPGPADAAHLERVSDAVGGRAVAALCLTHSHLDHAAAAAEAADRWGPVHASRETLARLDLEGIAIGRGDEIPLGAGRALEVHPSPGHSGDHLAFLYLPSRDLLTGDLVLGRGSSMVAYPDGSVGAYLDSLDRLAELRPSRLLPGHGPVVEAAVERLREYAEHRRERTEQVRRALEAGARSLEALRSAVYGPLPDGVAEAANLSLLAHLEHLREAGYDVPARLLQSSRRKTGRR